MSLRIEEIFQYTVNCLTIYMYMSCETAEVLPLLSYSADSSTDAYTVATLFIFVISYITSEMWNQAISKRPYSSGVPSIYNNVFINNWNIFVLFKSYYYIQMFFNNFTFLN